MLRKGKTMGYETHIVIGFLGDPVPELAKDLTNPYEDGSGYPYKKDKAGNPIKTGRMQRYLMPAVHLDLSKIDYSNLDLLHDKYLKVTEENQNEFVYFYHSDRCTEFSEDNYGDPLVLVPFKDVLEAVRTDVQNSDYRRFRWLLGLMEAMALTDNSKHLVCVFYGT